LVLAQLGWWTTVFLRDVRLVAELKAENLELLSHTPGAQLSENRRKIEAELFHRRLMFLSESSFFAFVTLTGLYLLYRALSVEERSRVIQSNFITLVTHESKTPITALKLRLESVLEKFGRAEVGLQRELGLALDEVRRLSSIFDNAMSMNPMEREAVHYEVIALGELVEEVARRLDPLFRARGVEIKLDLQAEAWVNGDRYALQNLVQSLIENAVLYNPADRKGVEVTVRVDTQRTILGVKDNGPGISAADRARLFERFYRGETGKGVPGTGLGLYIARSIVDAHHGSIHLLESSTPGAHFEITLPLAAA
jgi:two-component system sensor histidine kinase MprB